MAVETYLHSEENTHVISEWQTSFDVTEFDLIWL